MALVTNTVASAALRGGGVKVTLGTSDTTNILPTLLAGQACTCAESSKKGTIYSVDTYGNSFIVTPNNPSLKFEGNTSGFLSINDTISILIL